MYNVNGGSQYLGALLYMYVYLCLQQKTEASEFELYAIYKTIFQYSISQ